MWRPARLVAATALAAGVLAAVVAMPAVPAGAAGGDAAASLEAFRVVQTVIASPRCMNCHTNVAWPTQGDDQHRHTFNVVRGPDGRGPPGMKCSTCHQEQNQAAGNVPGAKDWHMAPLSMAWTGLSPGALCRSLTDPARNGGRTGRKVIEHLKADPLVVWAWAPGPRRTPPAVAHADFVKAAETWISKGAACPAP